MHADEMKRSYFITLYKIKENSEQRTSENADLNFDFNCFMQHLSNAVKYKM